MTKLWCMRGYSGSGKSTKAREIADATGAVIVCRDDLRKMLLGEYWTGKKEDEDRVTLAEEAQVTAFLQAGVSIVVDATHLHAPYLRRWAKLATRLDIEFEVVDVKARLTDCYERNALRDYNGERSVDPRVIKKQYDRFPVGNWPTITAEKIEVEPYVPAEDSYPAILVDIDGTLAHMNGRSPYDYTRVSEDSRDPAISWLVGVIAKNTDTHTIIMSGRDHTCIQDTAHWLRDHGISYDRLLMRPADAKDDRGNKLPDWIVKLNLFNEHIRPYYNVRFVLDDRQQVVDMWRKLGLKCLQVAEGSF